MAPNGVNDYKPNDVAYLNGMKVTVLSSQNQYGCLEVIDQFGITHSVRKDALKNGCVWDYEFVDPKVVAQYDKKIEECKNEKTVAKEYWQLCKDTVAGLFSNFDARFKWQLNDEQLAQVENAENDVYKAKSNYIASNNEYGSTLLDKFIYIT